MTVDPKPDAAPRRVAAFDFDGTLVPGDSLRPFLLRLLGSTRLAVALAEAGPSMAVAYRRGGRDAAKAALFRRAVTGLDSAAVDEAGRVFGAELAGRVRPDMADRVAWHRRAGHELVLVSASLTAYLEPFAGHLGLDQVIATRLEVGPDGALTGRLAGPNVRGEEKASRLRRWLEGDPAEIWAYGDSAGDREMLAMADHPTLVGRAPLPPL
jgi:phosphatidylglycerophosphatase C